MISVGIQRLVSIHQLPTCKKFSFSGGGGNILGSLISNFTKSFMRSSNPGGGGGNLRPNLSKPSIRSSNLGGRGILSLPRIG